MSYSYSLSESETFTVTHARHMAAKVATDLKRMQRFYGSPSDSEITDYEAEVTAFLKAGYNVAFVPIAARPRVGESKIRPLRDTIRYFRLLNRYYWMPRERNPLGKRKS